ncbi:MAG: hypothetical protein HOP10_12520 [Chitinophagaceae bacterium]|nr:hypothetical protein [Chitinophagaceae bacterium]
MKKWLIALLLFLFPNPAVFSQSGTEMELLQKLDSIQNTDCISKHFAGLYFTTTKEAIEFFRDNPAQTKNFIERLEISFAGFFFRSVDSFTQKKVIPMEWGSYFNNSSLSPLQYKLLGINAHINGDIWQALTKEFTLAEIQGAKESYFDFQKGLKKQYKEFYNESLKSSSKVRLLHNATAGLDKLYGKLMLGHWRKRQMKLAILFYTDKEKFSIELEKLRRKMKRIDQMILRNL